jgi:UDP:flavonoid glycosyltransferase YjiC (YdhE family)
VLRHLAAAVRESYEDTLPIARQADVIVTQVVAFGGMLAAQKLGIPWISTVLAPISFLSAYDPPVPSAGPWVVKLRKLGPGVMKAFWDLGRKQVLRWVQPIVELRREIGLPAGAHPVFEGSHSPALVLALFSRAFADPQPDWPPHTLVTGFPFYDRDQGHQHLSSELERFFDAGPPPIVFTLGSSAVGAAGDFYRQSLGAVTTIGCRALFLTGARPTGLPDTLPPGVITAPYAPHSLVFPRALANVHQGGVGTTAQALRAGRPMLVVPFGHDQYDNGERVRRLGSGEVLYKTRYNTARAIEKLQRLQDCSYAKAAARVAEIMRGENGSAAAADAIEKFASATPSGRVPGSPL